MKSFLRWMWLISLMMALVSCSSSKKGGEGDEIADGEEEFSDELPVADAQTDAVPEEGAVEEPSTSKKDEAPAEESHDGDVSSLGEPEAPPAPGGIHNDFQPEAPKESYGSMGSSEPSTPGSGEYESYTVQQGDTLMKIAFNTYGNVYEWRRIYELNKDKIRDFNMIPSGVSLKVEKPSAPITISRNGEKYLIKRGDTLGTISQDVYGTPKKWKKILGNNRELVRNPDQIFAGFYVYYVYTSEDEQEKQQYQRQAPMAQSPQQAPAATTPAVQGEGQASVPGGFETQPEPVDQRQPAQQ